MSANISAGSSKRKDIDGPNASDNISSVGYRQIDVCNSAGISVISRGNVRKLYNATGAEE